MQETAKDWDIEQTALYCLLLCVTFFYGLLGLGTLCFCWLLRDTLRYGVREWH